MWFHRGRGFFIEYCMYIFIEYFLIKNKTAILHVTKFIYNTCSSSILSFKHMASTKQNTAAKLHTRKRKIPDDNGCTPVQDIVIIYIHHDEFRPDSPETVGILRELISDTDYDYMRVYTKGISPSDKTSAILHKLVFCCNIEYKYDDTPDIITGFSKNLIPDLYLPVRSDETVMRDYDVIPNSYNAFGLLNYEKYRIVSTFSLKK